jgi:hypothetical protein
MDKLEREQLYGLSQSTTSRPTATTPKSKAWKWFPCVAVVLAVLGLHTWKHCAYKSESHHEPFSVVPSGGPGDMIVGPRQNGLEYGYIK